ncbi:hypothetical protein Ciccas_010853, partial [Cichlidogyrus casuarinus]
IAPFVKDNLGLLSAVLESVWMLLRSNLSILISILWTIISMLFGSSTVVLNFFLSMVT